MLTDREQETLKNIDLSLRAISPTNVGGLHEKWINGVVKGTIEDRRYIIERVEEALKNLDEGRPKTAEFVLFGLIYDNYGQRKEGR